MASAAEQMAANISLSNFSKATELKKRLWFTLGALILFRFLSYVPMPGIDPRAMASMIELQLLPSVVRMVSRRGATAA